MERMVYLVMKPLRKNGANGNETFSIGANTTGAFSDATGTDSIASGDKIAVGITPGSTALVITIIAATFCSTDISNTVPHMLSFQDLISQPTITGTYYSTPSGVTAYKTSSYNSTEANSKLRMRKAFTVNNFATFITVEVHLIPERMGLMVILLPTLT